MGWPWSGCYFTPAQFSSDNDGDDDGDDDGDVYGDDGGDVYGDDGDDDDDGIGDKLFACDFGNRQYIRIFKHCTG